MIAAAKRSSNDEPAWMDIQTRPAPAQLCPRAWLVLCDGGLARQRAIERPSVTRRRRLAYPSRGHLRGKIFRTLKRLWCSPALLVQPESAILTPQRRISIACRNCGPTSSRPIAKVPGKNIGYPKL